MSISNLDKKRPLDPQELTPPATPEKKARCSSFRPPNVGQKAPSLIDRKIIPMEDVSQKELLTHSLSSLEHAKLKNFYNIDFDHPPVYCQTEFFQIKEQLLAIEGILEKYSEGIDVKETRSIISKQLSAKGTNLAQKMAELGAIFFYLDNSHKLPCLGGASSYTVLYGQKIATEVGALTQLYLATYPKKNSKHAIEIHYMLRFFVRMLITSDRKLNIGALYTIIEILNKPSLKLVGYLTPEHHKHIYILLDTIAHQTRIQKLLETKIDIHPDLKDVVRLDLGLSKEKEVRPIHVMWSCLIALLYNVRQGDSPNCHAICALNYATQNDPYKVLSQLIDWLTKGQISHISTSSIPIFPLIENRIIYDKELQMELEKTDPLTLSIEKFTLDYCLRLLSESQDKIPFAGALYAFNKNAVTIMMLGIIEFQITNQENCPKSLRNLFISAVEESFCKEFDVEIWLKIKEMIASKLWLEDCSELHIQSKNKEIVVGPGNFQRTIKNFKGDVNSLIYLLQDACHFIYLEDGKYMPVNTISELQNLLKHNAQKIASELKLDVKTTKKLISFFSKKDFAKTMAIFCQKNLIEPKLTNADFLKNDLLLLQQMGGEPLNILSQVFQLNFAKEQWTAPTADLFLKHLHTALKKIDRRILRSAELIVMVTPEHAFTLSLSRCYQIWDNNPNFETFFDNSITQPVNAFLKQAIPASVVESIITNLYKNDPQQAKDKYAFFINQKELTYLSFQSQILAEFKDDLRLNEVEELIDSEFSKVTISKKELLRILDYQFLNITSDKDVEFIYQALIKKLGNKSVYPFQLARALRKILIKHFDKNKDVYVAEKAICAIKNMPLPLDIGDLNYMDLNKPVHERLVLRYHFGQKKICFFDRKLNQEILSDQTKFTQIEILYPKFI